MESSINQALEKAVAAHKENKLKKAKHFYDAVLEAQPEHPDANYHFALFTMATDKPEAAIPFFKKAAEAKPSNERYWLAYIEALLSANRLDEAHSAFSEAKRSEVSPKALQRLEKQLQFSSSNRSVTAKHKSTDQPSGQPSDLSLAVELREAGKWKKACEWLNEVIKHDPLNPEALSLLSQVLLLSKQEAKAQEVLSKAISINAQLPSVRRNHARLLLKQSNPKEALQTAELAYQESSEDPDNLLLLAICLGANGRNSEALPLFNELLSAHPDYAEAYASRALIKYQEDDCPGAIEDAEKATVIKPHLAQPWALLSSLYYQNEDLPAAVRAISNARENDPENIAFMVQLGNLLRQQNETEAASHILERAIKLAPHDPSAWATLGATLDQNRQITKAKTAYNQALRLAPQTPGIAARLGAIATTEGDLEAAHRYLEMAVKAEPHHAQLHFNLGVVFQDLDRLGKAEASYRKAIELRPNFSEAFSNLGMLLKNIGRLEDAEASYTKAIAAKPDFTAALLNRAMLSFEKNDFQAALRDADSCNTAVSRALSLEALYALGRTEEVYLRIKKHSELDSNNITVAAFAAYVAEKEARATASKFCRNPMEFLYFSNISRHVDNQSALITELLHELGNYQAVWEPTGASTHKGFHTPKQTNLFAQQSAKFEQLSIIILNEIETYFANFKDEQCVFISDRPLNGKLRGWQVVLKQQGYQAPHIHPGGWLSGVCYLKVVPSLGQQEGAIEFSLNGRRYSDLKYPKLIHQPMQGDIILFPSSLHHRTIPFTTEAERIIIGFDLLPDRAKR